ncbi:binding-protein-dependent transport systems inner membrane component [Ignisphaera aggregans DSM 17230]|uniref:Binding-protein-dependent transport systems inner membrane component n=1 Tax=Ignisphaera aggregans (strain DSM 17230 / JCM 13409 / AQ1.S1) TaxID=583356 RepID=E0SSA9_IGNAA|nr:binding-protein-dependent transport systems inner membrane component [Ignisphaera aggregans DSM 17230]
MLISLNYILKRLALSLSIIIGILVVTYILIYIAPGNPAYVWAGRPRGLKAEEAIENAVKELGLDKPLWMQIAIHITRFFAGDWGVSIRFKQPVVIVIARNLMATLELLFFGFLFAIPLSLILGIYSALYRDSYVGESLYTFMCITLSIPRFWIAIIFFLILQNFNINVFGRISPSYSIEINTITSFYTIDSLLAGRLDIFLDVLRRLIPPAIVIALYPASLIGRIIRYNLSERLNDEYVKQAISYGISRRIILFKYALRGVLPSIIQMTGMIFAYTIIDAATVESIFGREGIGSAIVKAIPYNDYPLIIGMMSVVTIVFIVVNTISDIVQAIIDPRVRL